MNNEINTNTILARPTKYIVFKFIFKILMSWIYFGNFKVQQIICETGKIKLIQNTKKQKEKDSKDFFPLSLILLIGLKPLPG